MQPFFLEEYVTIYCVIENAVLNLLDIHVCKTMLQYSSGSSLKLVKMSPFDHKAEIDEGVKNQWPISEHNLICIYVFVLQST